MEDNVDRLTREQAKKKEKLKDLIEKAKRENRDADSLERELQNLEKEQTMTKEMKEMANALRQARQALEMKDFDGLADKLGDVSKQLGEHRGRIAGPRGYSRTLAKPEADEEGRLQGMRRAKGPQEEGRGWRQGRRPATPKARRAAGPRTRTPRPRKATRSASAASSTPRAARPTAARRPARLSRKRRASRCPKTSGRPCKNSPEAIEVQRLPKAAKEMVKEYFEKLGNQAPPPKK